MMRFWHDTHGYYEKVFSISTLIASLLLFFFLQSFGKNMGVSRFHF